MNENLSFINKNGVDFVSAKEIANILSANQYYNSEVNKLEIKFKEYTIKFTAKNQFVIVNRKTNDGQSVFQLPISTLLVKDEVFIPLIYSLNYLSLGYGRKIIYYENNKSLVVTNEVVKPEQILAVKTNVSSPIAIKSQERLAGTANGKYDIYGISVEDKSNGTLIRLKSNRKFQVPKYSINEGTLYVFLTGVTVIPNLAKMVNPAGLVKEIKNVSVSKKNVQLEILLKDGYASSDAYQDMESNDILITIHNKLFSGSSNIENVKSKWIFDAVVIDAGHGGKDPGAIGVTGVREKNINLAIALKLGSLIEKNLSNIKVIYTRKTDEFIELYKRGKIANEQGGKLFVSIHCNSTEAKDIANRGFEVYLLRPGRTKQAIQIAEFENSVIKYEENPERYQKLTDENFILVSMAHSQYMRFSEKFSDILNQNWKREVEVPSLGIKQAGFLVLVGASMPGVLIENGFLSNRKDEAYLASTAGQKEIAQAIFSTIKKYKEYYDKEMGI
jgi:N-acetylmuramoyl-L-alanine amidase